MILVDFHNHIGRSRDGASAKVSEILKGMKECRIRYAVVFATDEKNPGLSYVRLNSKVIQAVGRHRGLIGFARLDPKAGSYAIQELRRCVAKGLKGVKLHPRSESFPPEKAVPILREISKLKLPLILHSSHEDDCRPEEWAPMIKRFSDVVFILAHGGKDHYLQAAKLARRFRNVYLETSTLSYFRSRAILEEAGSRRVIFASDFPYSHPLIEEQKIKLIADRAARQNIFFENGRRIFGFLN